MTIIIPQRYGGKPGDCPVTEDASDRLLRLPFYNGLTEREQSRVVEAVVEYCLDTNEKRIQL